ncbi:MAG: hypothetical protein IJU10_05385, partial [Clostridia bacterium]|nr:hypothetical protein [Clostridia bacterium]
GSRGRTLPVGKAREDPRTMKPFENIARKMKEFFAALKSKFDKGGSYTGTPDDGSEEPQQDVDDL